MFTSQKHRITALVKQPKVAVQQLLSASPHTNLTSACSLYTRTYSQYLAFRTTTFYGTMQFSSRDFSKIIQKAPACCGSKRLSTNIDLSVDKKEPVRLSMPALQLPLQPKQSGLIAKKRFSTTLDAPLPTEGQIFNCAGMQCLQSEAEVLAQESLQYQDSELSASDFVFDTGKSPLAASEHEMCTKAITDILQRQSLAAVLANEDLECEATAMQDARILEFSASRGQLGDMLYEAGFEHLYAQEGSEAKKLSLQRKGVYKGIEAFIVGKQGLPTSYRRTFDIVTCSGGLGTNLLPKSCFDDMLNALKPHGHCVFTVSQKHLQTDSAFKTGYLKAIEKLTARGSWRMVVHEEFLKSGNGGAGSTSEEPYSLLVFQKE